MRSRLVIHTLTRTPREGEDESLKFKLGVNVIVGQQNSGKSTWLKMLDFLLFETDSAKTRFDPVIVSKYKGVSADMTAGDRRLVLSRQWDEDGARSVLLIDNERISAPEAESLLLRLLQIPELRYPQGAASSERTWPTLGWRSIYRHIYRRQEFWNELVARQPDSEQHAVLLQFLGLAEKLFSEDLAKLVDKRREIARAENRKDFFFQLVQQIAPGLFAEQELQVGLTEASIETAKRRLDAEIGELIVDRSAELERIRQLVDLGRDDLQALLSRRAEVLADRGAAVSAVAKLERRLTELRDYRQTLGRERERLTRAEVSASIFSDLRITHCPACDQSVEARHAKPGCCFLCDQALASEDGSDATAKARLKFEQEQIAKEVAEAGELIAAAQRELTDRAREVTLLERALEALETTLRPFQANASQLVPESVALLDQKIGGLGARKQSLDRLYDPLRERDAFSARIDQLRREALDLEARVAAHEEGASFESASDWLSEGFTTYLNRIRAMDPQTWTKGGAVTVRVSDRKTNFFIDGKPAKTQLGGTLTIYFSFAYQYALLDLMRRPGTHYPGLAVLDAFPDIAKGAGLRTPMGVVLRPFVELAAQQEIAPVQVILTARDFPTSEPVHFIPLRDVWR
ncbi:hypothetical protein [Caulobacter hibisci]|uniref:Rad50/SbcC-type AAA domain-containing protein n=1 Tax=Caulobacter hibisci TaxID=2035993 RepID=A0ABS0SVI6_9CAUL|nr:hypothetical protein [Caulobacter hibisci]MBI1682693.1 hypothetical protein [Caulobacter hibisci]